MSDRPIPVTRCVPCIFDDLVGALKTLDIPQKEQDRILDEALSWMASEFPARRTPSYYITGVHRILKRVSGIETPFLELRNSCNNVGVQIARRVWQSAEKKEGIERFRLLLLWTMAGNHLDSRTVGTGYDYEEGQIESDLQEHVDAGFHVDRVEEIYQAFRQAKRVLYIPDNVGEIAFDRLLVEEFIRWGVEVEVPYRGGPITSDATLEDFQAVGLDTAATRVFEAGPDTLGIQMEDLSPRMMEAIESHDYIFTKGQANYYLVLLHGVELGALVASVLTTKCDAISRTFGYDRDRISVATMSDFRRP